MAEQAFDLRSGVPLLRQKWRLLAWMGAVGVVLGLAYATLVPPRLGSSTLILLPAPVGGQQGASNSEVDTQVLLALSATVLERAGRDMSPPLSAEEAKGRVEVTARTSQLIEIRAFSTKARQAQALSQKVADTYIVSVRDTARTVTRAALSDLRKRDEALERQLNTLRAEIDAALARQGLVNPTTPAGLREAQLLAQLRAEQANTSLQQDKVRDDIFVYSTVGAASRAGSSIVQPASPATGPSPLRRIVTLAPLGFLVGVLGAAATLLVHAGRDQRIRLRDDLADAVGSTVLADVRSRPQRSVAEWSTLLETYEAGPVEAWAYRQVLRALVPIESRGPQRNGRTHPGRPAYPRSLTLISLSGDDRGLAVAPQLAAFAASLGIVTRLIVTAGHESASSLWAACAVQRDHGLRPGLLVEARSADDTDDLIPPAQDLPAEAESVDDEHEPRKDEAGRQVQRSNGQPNAAVDDVSEWIAGILRRHAAELTEEKTQGEPQAPPEPVIDSSPPPKDAPKPPESTTEPSADLVIVVTVADRRQPMLRGVRDTAVTLLAIAPGTATTAELARVAASVDDSGRRIEGIVVADPDAWDRTSGRRSLDERARQVPLPVRLTGIGRVATPATDRGQAS